MRTNLDMRELQLRHFCHLGYVTSCSIPVRKYNEANRDVSHKGSPYANNPLLVDLLETSRRLYFLCLKDVNKSLFGRVFNCCFIDFPFAKKIPCISTSALFFDVSRSIIYSVVLMLWRFFSGEVVWPSIAERDMMRGYCSSFDSFPRCTNSANAKK